MELNGRKILICDCERTMPLDAGAIGKASGGTGGLDVNTHLCRAQLDNFRAAAASGQHLVVACTQEAPLFQETLDEMDGAGLAIFTNIRERAGWSAQAKAAQPKIAALLAEATLEVPAAPSVTLRSEGVCLVYGRDERAIEAARQLAARLDVTVLLSRPQEVLAPRVMDVPIFQGTIATAKGHLGAFELIVNDYAPTVVSARQSLGFAPSSDGAATKCDLILDLSRDAPLFPAPEKRDGYFNPDPDNPAAVQRALFDLTDLVGEFEKPRYIDFNAEICAHSRSLQTGCTRCLDVCPAAAIQPDGDVVAIDPFLCGGCGACNSVCPTGAAGYTMPPTATLLERVRVLLTTYAAAGGTQPVLLVHDERHGDEMISLMARHGRGLPANVVPFAVNEVTQIGLDFLVGALAKGAAQVLILVPPERQGELQGLAGQVGLAETVMVGLGFGSGRTVVLVETDPEAVEQLLYQPSEIVAPEAGPYLPLGGKRSLMRQALQHLHKVAPQPVDHVFLPPQAPFGAVKVEVEGCTLCLACVSACPTGALLDNPETPELRFQEDACIQCGLCKNTCPESVISLEPRLSFTDQARQAVVVKREQLFNCVRCGKPFGTKSSIERIVAQLAGKHAMFQGAEAIERMKMCQDCRVASLYSEEAHPMAGGERPLTRTTDDYLRERAEIEAARAKFRAEQGAPDDGDDG